jgi:hypothetical protein
MLVEGHWRQAVAGIIGGFKSLVAIINYKAFEVVATVVYG